MNGKAYYSMKKILIVILILLINFNIVHAGRSITLNFDEQISYIIPLYEKDRIVFGFDDDNHTLILDEIKERRVEFDVFIYQERNKNIKEGDERDAPIYAFADTVNLLKFDLNRDGVFDFKLDVLDYDQQKALIELTRIEEIKENTIGPPVDLNPKNKAYNNIWLLSGGVVLILVIFLVIILNKFKKNKKWSYH